MHVFVGSIKKIHRSLRQPYV